MSSIKAKIKAVQGRIERLEKASKALNIEIQRAIDFGEARLVDLRHDKETKNRAGTRPALSWFILFGALIVLAIGIVAIF